MKPGRTRKFILALGPLFSLTLIGLLLLSAILYYRAVKIQRFLEPALAISEPRMKFTQNIRGLLAKEIGPQKMKGITFRGSTIIVDQSLFFDRDHSKGSPTELVVLKKFSRVFLSALDTPEIRENISLILITVRYPLSNDTMRNRQMRFRGQDTAVLILNSIFSIEPKLERNYTNYFTATALPAGASKEDGGLVVEFRLIPTERLHIEVLQRLERYAY